MPPRPRTKLHKRAKMTTASAPEPQAGRITEMKLSLRSSGRIAESARLARDAILPGRRTRIICSAWVWRGSVSDGGAGPGRSVPVLDEDGAGAGVRPSFACLSCPARAGPSSDSRLARGAAHRQTRPTGARTQLPQWGGASSNFLQAVAIPAGGALQSAPVIVVALSGSQALSAPSLVSAIVASHRPRPGDDPAGWRCPATTSRPARCLGWQRSSRSGYLIEVDAFAVTDG